MPPVQLQLASAVRMSFPISNHLLRTSTSTTLVILSRRRSSFMLMAASSSCCACVEKGTPQMRLTYPSFWRRLGVGHPFHLTHRTGVALGTACCGCGRMAFQLRRCPLAVVLFLLAPLPSTPAIDAFEYFQSEQELGETKESQSDRATWSCFSKTRAFARLQLDAQSRVGCAVASWRLLCLCFRLLVAQH